MASFLGAFINVWCGFCCLINSACRSKQVNIAGYLCGCLFRNLVSIESQPERSVSIQWDTWRLKLSTHWTRQLTFKRLLLMYILNACKPEFQPSTFKTRIYTLQRNSVLGLYVKTRRSLKVHWLLVRQMAKPGFGSHMWTASFSNHGRTKKWSSGFIKKDVKKRKILGTKLAFLGYFTSNVFRLLP